jgi:peptide/nickel transport system permease protein
VEVSRADYITTARAKGMKEKAIVYKEMLPNALMPTITNMGRILSGIIAGAPVIESVFSIPGVGNYLLTAINQRDYPAVRACVLFFTLCVSIIMLLVDLAYAAVDPRIKAQFSKGGR